MTDPMNRPAHPDDPRPCASCGEDTLLTRPIGAWRIETAICDACDHDQVNQCVECGVSHWTMDGYRIGTELYCGDCGSKHPMVCGDIMAAIHSDERRAQR